MNRVKMCVSALVFLTTAGLNLCAQKKPAVVKKTRALTHILTLFMF